MDILTNMRSFCAVVEQGNFTNAADHLGIAKALVSKYVAQLEEHLGIRLLNRTTRNVSVTETGQLYYERCQQLLEDLDDLETSIQARDAKPHGRLKITAPTTFGELYLTEVISDFLSEHPFVEIQLTLTDRFVNIIEEGFDLALRIGKLDDTSLVARKLGDIRLVTCASSEYLNKYGYPSHPSELGDHACVLDSNMKTVDRWPYHENGKQVNIPVKGPFQVNSAQAVRNTVLNHAGIGNSPIFVVNKDIKAGHIKILLEDYELPAPGLFAVYPHRKHLANKTRAFIDFLQLKFKHTPPWKID
ncbi:LysR family transcriptional regulator [Rhodospirillaceae bacterium RKSG073]|nr:LysR family transcriptional regulator [Curvivirga aplysinae]